MEQEPEPVPWYFEFQQSARWWDDGQQVLLFKSAHRNPKGEWHLAFRSPPYDMPLPGPLAGVRHTAKGWWRHPASEAAKKHYGLEEAVGIRRPTEPAP